MRRPTLTPPPSRLDNGVVSTEYEWRGRRVWVRDSARTALLVIELFSDGAMSPAEKAELLPEMMFPFPDEAREAAGDEPAAMVSDLVWEAYGLDIAGGEPRESGEQAFCWVQDAARIRASLMAAYGIDWDRDASRIPFCDAAALLASLMETRDSTPFSEAIEARFAEPPKPSRHNRELRAAMAARKRHFALRGGQSDRKRAESAESAMADMFESAKRAAVRHGR